MHQISNQSINHPLSVELFQSGAKRWTDQEAQLALDASLDEHDMLLWNMKSK